MRPSEAYRVCLECFTVFDTEGDLVAAHRRLHPEQVRVDPASVTVCPACLHDFDRIRSDHPQPEGTS